MKTTPPSMTDRMTINFVEEKGRVFKKQMRRDDVIAACLKELLLSHDGLYRSVFPNPPATPQWDIAAKNARKIYACLIKKKPFPRLTIEEEFIA